MKFLYEYRTPDNEKHQGEIQAADREAAYALLKKQGIKPCRFSEAPGILNKVFGKGKRWIAITVLGALCGALALAVLTFRRENTALHFSLFTFHSTLDAAMRRQVIGDAAVIEKGVRTGWADVFELEGDRFLASFAIPGVPPAVRSTTEAEVLNALNAKHDAPSAEPEGLEARQIRAIVAGMKDELREFMREGGSVASYGRRLVERQEQELGYYNRVKTELETAVKAGADESTLEALWEDRNASLRAMGVKLVPMPSVDEKK